VYVANLLLLDNTQDTATACVCPWLLALSTTCMRRNAQAILAYCCAVLCCAVCCPAIPFAGNNYEAPDEYTKCINDTSGGNITPENYEAVLQCEKDFGQGNVSDHTQHTRTAVQLY
jgi:hypothetical protein